MPEDYDGSKGIVEGCFLTWVEVTEKYKDKLNKEKMPLFNSYKKKKER